MKFRAVPLIIFSSLLSFNPLFGAENPSSPAPDRLEIQYRRSIEFEALTTQIYRLAYDYISKSTASSVYPQGEKVIVLDVDDTVLDNSPYQIENPVFSPATWDIWTHKKAALAVAGAQDFLDKARLLASMHIVFITDRTIDQEADTLINLRAQGLFKDGDMILTKRDKTDSKGIRRQCVEQAIDERCRALGPRPIIALFGDSARDFEEFYSDEMLTTGRKLILENAASRFWILPNNMYGQWQRNYK